jgi:hypothetical protein
VTIRPVRAVLPIYRCSNSSGTLINALAELGLGLGFAHLLQ